MKNSTLEILPSDQQTVLIQSDYFGYSFFEAKFYEETQEFEVLQSGLMIKAQLVNQWEEI